MKDFSLGPCSILPPYFRLWPVRIELINIRIQFEELAGIVAKIS